MVRMGELAASAVAGDVLVSLGLGSCIGLALLDRRHAASPAWRTSCCPQSAASDAAGTLASSPTPPCPQLLDRVVALGARRPLLEAVLVGGASMFAVVERPALEVGQRNEAAVREQLARAPHPRRRGRDRRRRAAAPSASTSAAHRSTVREAGGAEHRAARAGGALEVAA